MGIQSKTATVDMDSLISKGATEPEQNVAQENKAKTSKEVDPLPIIQKVIQGLRDTAFRSCLDQNTTRRPSAIKINGPSTTTNIYSNTTYKHREISQCDDMTILTEKRCNEPTFTPPQDIEIADCETLDVEMNITNNKSSGSITILCPDALSPTQDFVKLWKTPYDPFQGCPSPLTITYSGKNYTYDAVNDKLTQTQE